MPYLLVTTNVKLEDSKKFALEFSKFAAETLQKPLKYMSVCYSYNETLAFHGTFEPAFILNVLSLNNINPEANLEFSKSFFKYMKEKLGVEPDRGYIDFNDPGTSNVGYDGTTFKKIFG